MVMIPGKTLEQLEIEYEPIKKKAKENLRQFTLMDKRHRERNNLTLRKIFSFLFR